MRGFRDRRPATKFRGAELPRLLTMVVMLGVLWMLFQRAREPTTWKWLAPDDPGAQTAAANAEKATKPAAQAPPAGPTDLDPAERDAAQEEFQAVADKVPLGPEEMPAYWRLLGWARNQSVDQLLSRAAPDVTFRDLWHQSDKYRGKLIELRVHLRRTATVDDVEQNPLGIKSLDEVWAWNSDSQPYWYWLVVPELPPGMPRGNDVYEEATFVGYFLKLLPYEDRQGKTLATPLLIGRLVWHPTPDGALARRDEWKWTGYIVAGLLALFAVRWGLTLWGRRRTSPELPTANADERAVEQWLAGEGPTPAEPIATDEATDGATDEGGYEALDEPEPPN